MNHSHELKQGEATDRQCGPISIFKAGAAALLVALLVAAAFGASAASAATPAWWNLTVSGTPAHLAPGGEGRIDIGASDIGDIGVDGRNVPVTISDALPAGVEATTATASAAFFNEREPIEEACTIITTRDVTCNVPRKLAPFEHLEVSIAVRIAADAASGNDRASILGGEQGESAGGGEVPDASVTRPVIVSSEPARFGVERYELVPENEGGSVDSQAGSHPFQLTASIALNQSVGRDEEPGGKFGRPVPVPAALAKDLNFDLPPGLIGNVTQTPECTAKQFTFVQPVGDETNACPAGTAVGVAQLSFSSATLSEPGEAAEEPLTVAVPLFNLEPSVGEPARFGLEYEGRPVFLDTSVRTGSDYGVTVSVKNILQEVGFLGGQVTIWGVPGESQHHASRGWGCIARGKFEGPEPCQETTQGHPKPLLTLPSQCASPLTEPLQTTATADSWNEPNTPVGYTDTLQNDAGAPLALEGCGHLPFSPSISFNPDTHSASSAAGLTVGVHVPQEASETANGVAESDLRDTTVTLPQGMTLNPSAANGLAGCSEAQIAFHSPGAGSCPDASKVGTVSIETPLLPKAQELKGSVYVASPQNFAGLPRENPFESLVALYIEAEDPVSGVIVKLAAKVTPNATTGQLTTTVENTPQLPTPQLPFEDLKLEFFGGARAPLSTPPACGTYTSNASFTPYSGTAPVQSSASFEVTSGPEGTACAASRPFAPSFTAGTTVPQAGAFSPFTLTFSRRDQDQNLGAISVQTLPGLLGDLAGVPLCGEAQANAGTCSPASQIGVTTTEAGVGSQPVTLPQPGQAADLVYLTGPYDGQPFGLSFVVPAVAGPFDLGTVVVRASIAVNRSTSALTITSNPLPRMLRGVPLDIKTVNVTVNRPGFMFNPTNCSPQSIAASITSSQGASAALSSPFAVTNCATLAFKPTLRVSTAGRASKAGGASLDVRITSKGGPGAPGEEANIRSVKVDLPIKLPSRLTTLQRACLAKVFDANPASCHKESNVGSASATTPILAHPLVGPAYLVSHGGEAFPSLEIVLQGEGITLLLEGKTRIKKGVTSSTFRTVPDAPISSFELKLPTGKFSILGANLPARANYSFCGQTLSMPTAITAQNGAVYKPATKISVTGCPKAKAKHKHKHKHKHRAKSGGRSR